MNTGGKTYYYHYDPLGSAVNLTTSTGASQWTDSYEPYGPIHTETKNDTKAPTNLMKYTGQYLDPTGLYHLRARQYDPASGRFLTIDPILPTQTDPYVSAYAYANDAPTLLVDPSGLSTGGICGGFSFTVWRFSWQSKGCVVASTSGQFGITGSGGPSWARVKWSRPSASFGVQVSSARCIEDLGGPFVDASASGKVGLGPQGNVFAGRGTQGQPVVGGEIGVGAGLPGRTVTGGGTWTKTDVLAGKHCSSPGTNEK